MKRIEAYDNVTRKFITCRLPYQTALAWDKLLVSKNVKSSELIVPVIQKFLDKQLTIKELPYFKYTNQTQKCMKRRIVLSKSFNYKLKATLDKLEIQHSSFMRSIVEYILDEHKRTY
jgi:hypothetical protein